MRFWAAKFRKFPVFFPGSREFRQRMVSARLRPPPRSLELDPVNASGHTATEIVHRKRWLRLHELSSIGFRLLAPNPEEDLTPLIEESVRLARLKPRGLRR